MQALVIVHDPGSLPAMVGRRLREHGFDLIELPLTESVDSGHSDVHFPDPSDFDLIVPMGAVWSVYDHGTIGSWIVRELDLLRQADEAGVPILGVCFGFQALASALGGETKPAETPQIGWYHVQTTVPDAIASGPWMEWHYDRSEPPPDAEVLAFDETCVQAFRVRNHVGVQFHPEVDGPHVERWLEMGGAEEVAAFGLDPDRFLADSVANAAVAKPNTDRLVDWFLSDVARIDTALGRANA